MRNLKSYDSLVRRILDSEEKPAVILLFTTQENGKSLQSTHMKIGIAYGLPMLSYRNAVLPAIQEGLFKWSDISPDNIHPNTRGHALIGEIIARYLDSVYTRLSVLDCNVKALPKAITEDIYREAEIYNSLNITPAEADGFTVQTVFEPFPDGWHTESGGSLKFEIQAACIGVLYYRTTDGLNGKYTVYIDGKVVGELDGDFSGGWGSYAEAAEIYTSDRKMIHTIEIKTAVDSEKKKFSVLGLSVS